MSTWIFLCFQKIQFTKDQELRIQVSEVILLFYHLRQLLSEFFSSGFFPHIKLCGKGHGPNKIKKKKNNQQPNSDTDFWHQLRPSDTQSK